MLSPTCSDQFQQLFFDYQIPIPNQSVYDEQYIKSNDLRLLLQIATQSTLRMYTDSKTNRLHFICKKKGSNCFDIEAEPHQQNGYYFTYNYLSTKHKCNCTQKNEGLWYLTIYNLMKIKKNLIKEYMTLMNVQNQTPSFILSKLSGSNDKYFFEQYINGHMELKRKLRKKFDNVVNIDIKKIGKEDKEVKEEDSEDKIIKVKPEENKILKKQDRNNAQKKVKQTKKSKKVKNAKSKNKSKRIRKRQKENYREQSQRNVQSSYSKYYDQYEQYDFPRIYAQKKSQLQRELFKDASVLYVQQISPGVQQQKPIYIWSDSDQEYSYDKAIEENAFNPFDYFQSVTNSALKLSLDQSSMQNTLFSTNLQK